MILIDITCLGIKTSNFRAAHLDRRQIGSGRSDFTSIKYWFEFGRA
jgi:hypothetical protein